MPIKRNSKNESIGDCACKAIIEYLEYSKEYRLNIHTFTEIFSYLYFEIDHSLYIHQINLDDGTAKNIIKSYLITIDSIFNASDAEYFLKFIDKRIQEYGNIINDEKTFSNVFKRMEFHLNQSSCLSENNNEESHVLLRDVFSMMGGALELSNFYASSLSPLVRTIVEEEVQRHKKFLTDREIRKNSNDQSKTFFGGIYHPWRRFFARTTDILIFGIFSIFIVSFFVGLFFPSSVESFVNAIGNPIIAGVMLSILWIPAEAAFIAGTGTTPAKWIFGISVLDIEGEKLRYSAALKRAFLVWIQGQCLGIPLLSFFAYLFAYRKLIKTGTTLWDTSTKSIVDHKEWGVARASASIFVVILTAMVNRIDSDPYNSFDIENKSASLIQSKEHTARGYVEAQEKSIENKQKDSHILGYDIHLNDGRIIPCNELVKFNNGCFYLFGDNLRMNIPADKIKIINELYKIEDLYKLRAVNQNSIFPVENKIVLGYDVILNNGERINCKFVQKESQDTISLFKKNLSKDIFSNEEVENIEEVSAIENGVRVRVIPPELL